MKTVQRCMFVQTKVYYHRSDGAIKYGHNSNEPKAWHDMVEYFFGLRTITNSWDVKLAFTEFFESVYRQILEQPGLESLLRVTQDIKIKSTYNTMTPANEFKIYMSANHPALAGGFRHNVYYFHLPHYTTKTVYRPSFKLLSEVDADASMDEVQRIKLGRLKKVNLFKYVYSMFKTVYNIVMFHVKRNNAPFNVTLNDSHVRSIMLSAYLDVTVSDSGTTDEAAVDQMTCALAHKDNVEDEADDSY